MLDFIPKNFLYLFLLAFSISYPLIQSFEKRLKYYKKFKRLFKGIIIMSLVFIPWDIWFTSLKVWGFNSDFLIGISLFGLPLEEWLFFFVIPYACLFIYEVLNYFFPRKRSVIIKPIILKGIGFIFMVLAGLFYERLYSFSCFLIVSIICFFASWKKLSWYFNFFRMFLVSLVPFLLINGVLTGSLIESPIVHYSADHIMGIRIFTIPLEDIMYNFIMLFLVVYTYENHQESN